MHQFSWPKMAFWSFIGFWRFFSVVTMSYEIRESRSPERLNCSIKREITHSTTLSSFAQLCIFLVCLTFHRLISSSKKCRNKTSEKIPYFFHVYLISPISCWHVTCLLRHSVRSDEWTAKPSPFSIQGSLWEFPRIMAANTEIPVLKTWNILFDIA